MLPHDLFPLNIVTIREAAAGIYTYIQYIYYLSSPLAVLALLRKLISLRKNFFFFVFRLTPD